MKESFSIKVNKQYFNFSAAHFLIFADGNREPLHGHNYRVAVSARQEYLKDDMVFDFLDIKPLVKKVCDALDHKLLLPATHPLVDISQSEGQVHFTTPLKETFIFPQADILLLPIPNTSAERLAKYLAENLQKLLWDQYQIKFKHLSLEVEETPGQSATIVLQGEES